MYDKKSVRKYFTEYLEYYEECYYFLIDDYSQFITPSVFLFMFYMYT